MTSSNSNYLPKAPSPNITTLGVGVQHINLEGTHSVHDAHPPKPAPQGHSLHLNSEQPHTSSCSD